MVEGHLQEVVEQVKYLIKEEVFRTWGVTTLVIMLAAKKIYSFGAFVKQRWKRASGSFER